MDLAAAQTRQRLHCKLCRRVCDGRHRKGNQHLVGVKPGVRISQMLDLQMLNGREDHGGNEIHIVADVGKRFERIEQRRAACAHQT